jgi:NAD(P)-dependent dehydrogenase (short-subunit alcohol dehydrogenase family)
MVSAQKVALVTGASAGIGRATALALSEAGYTVYAGARHVEPMKDLQEQGLRVLRLDVTDERSMAEAVSAIEAEHGAVDVLVNNAGISEMGPVEEVSMERIRREFETNVFGLIRLCQLALPGMRRKGWGRIVNMSSMGGEFTVPFGGIYHASKHAVEAVSDALRFEVQPFGVAVIVIQPGVVQTGLGQAILDALQSPSESPYAGPLARYRGFLEANAEPEEGAALYPEDVARVVVEAVQAEMPETRYKVGQEAEDLPALRKKLTDREWDDIYRGAFG